MTDAPQPHESVEGLNKLLQRCDKNALVGVIKDLCAMFQDTYLDEPEEHDGFLRSRDVRGIVCRVHWKK
jgi:hypothetical protein